MHVHFIPFGPTSPAGWLVCFSLWITGGSCYKING